MNSPARWACKRFRAPFNYRSSRGPLPSWDVLEDQDIDLEYHLRHSALPQPGNEQELGILVSRLHSHALDRRRPLWECHVIEGLEGGRFAIYLKLHHGQLDGMGAAGLMQRCFSPDPKARDMAPPWAVGMAASGGDAARSAPGLTDTLRAAPEVLKTMTGMLREALTAPDGRLSVPFQAPNSLLNGRVHGPRRYATQAYELARLKAVAKAAGVTLN